MIGEVDLFGVYLPPLLVWLLMALVLSACVRWVLNRLGVYRVVWHRPLFDISLLVILTGLVNFVMNRFF